MTEAIKVLTIGKQEIEAKGSFKFASAAKQFDSKDEEGNKVDGFTKIYNGLLQRKTESIVDFWVCATAKHTKIKRSQIEDAIEEVIEEHEDTIELLQGAMDVLDNSGFFKQEVRNFWYNVAQGYKAADSEDKEKMKNSAQLLKDMHKVILNGGEPEEEAETQETA